MIQTIEATIDERGTVHFPQTIQLPSRRRALVIILDEEATSAVSESALLSEAALADWNRPEEDEAWAHLQSEP